MRISLSIALFIVLAVSGSARENDAASFHIRIIEGEGALNSIQSHVSHEPVIRVEDRNHKPLFGAYVEFDTPNNGPGGSFANGSTHFATTTNSSGIAVATGLRNNSLAGSFVIEVHVSYQGQTVCTGGIHQTNLTRRMAGLSNTLQGAYRIDPTSVSTSPSDVLGIAMGDQFQVNGATTSSNANLLKSSRVQTLASPATLYVRDHCEFLVGPHSSITIPQPHMVAIESGAIRAKHFGNCKMGYGGLWVTSSDPGTDGVIAITGDSMEVGSVNGQLEVINTLGDLVGQVSPGSTSTFGATTVASGATVGGPRAKGGSMLLLGGAMAATLAGLGLAVDAYLQPTSTSP